MKKLLVVSCIISSLTYLLAQESSPYVGKWLSTDGEREFDFYSDFTCSVKKIYPKPHYKIKTIVLRQNCKWDPKTQKAEYFYGKKKVKPHTKAKRFYFKLENNEMLLGSKIKKLRREKAYFILQKIS
ncbi:MAG: hypothetical protein GXO11_08570 [Epsilonproteobacteria bacterium]|nr:hypothetical protein [Campylobacterota bacterium]